jgi:hypothetical protein
MLVSQGLCVPGTKAGVKVVNGAAFGQGIYLSRKLAIPYGYSFPNHTDNVVKIIACATLRGESSLFDPSRPPATASRSSKRRKKHRRMSAQGKTVSTYDASNDIWVLPTAAQVLPLFIFSVHDNLPVTTDGKNGLPRSGLPPKPGSG